MDRGRTLNPYGWTTIRAGLTAALLGAAPSPAMALAAAEPQLALIALNAEARLRYDSFNNAQAMQGNDHQQTLLRGILAASLRVGQHLRVHGEAGTGQVWGRRDIAGANFQNAASLQQFYVDASTSMGNASFGATVGRQEFADAPKQLLSVGDGPNLHRSWNGVRLYAVAGWLRASAFDLRATRLGRGQFDESINHGERLQGLNANLSMPGSSETALSLDPFWLHSENPAFRVGGRIGLDARDTVGLRLWGRHGRLALDWTLARQTGRHSPPSAGNGRGRRIDAWALFTVHSLALSGTGWKPRLTARLDIASGGSSGGSGTLRGFNQLYASSNYLGEGQFLSLNNLVMVTPGLSLTPTERTRLSAEYGLARRYSEQDAAYAGGMRTYAGTQDVAGREIGGLLRVVGSWSPQPALTLTLNLERFNAGTVLKRAGLPSGGYAYLGATYRY